MPGPLAWILLAGGASGAAMAGLPPAVGEVVVTARTPLSAAAGARAQVSADQIAAEPAPAALLGALERRTAAVSLNQAQGNPWQPNLSYRGFEASPLAGDGQGLAVYVDGARFNQPFGDTVDFDLIPDAAIDRAVIEEAEPSFGLNALGGALSLKTKDGFDWTGAQGELTGGTWGWRRGALQLGASDGARAGYLALARAHDDGWRRFSPSDLSQAFASLALRGERGEARLSLSGADNDLTGDGPAPVELLAADRRAVFTHPDETRNRHLRAQLSGSWRLGKTAGLAGVVYLGQLNQRTANADASDAEACGGALCLDGEVLTDPSGSAIPDPGGPYAMLNRTSTRTTAYGASLEAHGAWRGPLGAHRWTLGAALDGGRTRFEASARIGALTADRGFAGPGVVVDQPDGPIAPVQVQTRNDTFGVYGADTLDLGGRLSATVSGRYNQVRTRLDDRLGTALDGRHRFARFNPALRLDWRPSGRVRLHAAAAETSRAPTPAELSCADPQAPCSLTNFFVADPPLKEVTARTVSAGAEGDAALGAAALSWSLELYSTGTRDDILFTAADTLGRAYFRNIGRTRRRGLEAGLDLQLGKVSAYGRYALVDATFRSAAVLNSPENPMADPDGRIRIAPGDRMPGVPRHTVKLGASWRATAALTLEADGRYASGQVLFGDEANLTPRTDGYAVLDLSARWRVARGVELFGSVENVTDAGYATFGAFSPTDRVPMAEAPGASNPRSLSPGTPRRAFFGVRVRR